MNQDFRVSIGFFSHPKTIKLKHRLKAQGIVGLLGLWSHAAAHNWSGKLEGYTSKEIAMQSGWSGNPKKFVDALVECGFLDILSNESGFVIHDWAYWNEYATKAQERVEKARKAANARYKNADSNASTNDLALYPLPPDSPEETIRYISGGKR